MNKDNIYIYPAVFEVDDEGSCAIRFPDFNNCYTSGNGVINSMKMARERLGLEIELYSEDKRKLPVASDVKKIKTSKGFTTLIDVDMFQYNQKYNSEMVKKNCTLPKWLNDIAMDKRINFSSILQEALKEKLGVI